MEDVSDPPFRALCKKHGADIMYTEFISSEGLIRDAAKSIQKLDIYEKERPVGIQIFGSNIESMLKAVEIVEATNPDIILSKSLKLPKDFKMLVQQQFLFTEEQGHKCIKEWRIGQKYQRLRITQE